MRVFGRFEFLAFSGTQFIAFSVCPSKDTLALFLDFMLQNVRDILNFLLFRTNLEERRKM